MRYLFFYCFTLFFLYFYFGCSTREDRRIPPANAMIMTPANAFQSISLTPAAEVFPLTVATIPQNGYQGIGQEKIVRGVALSPAVNGGV